MRSLFNIDMDFLNDLLNYYQLSKEQYEIMTRPLSYGDLRFDYRVKGLEPLLVRIKKAIASKEKILLMPNLSLTFTNQKAG